MPFTKPRAGAGEAREGIGNFARSRGWDFNPFNNNRQGEGDPNAMGPPAPPVFPGSAYGPPTDLATYNNTTPGSAYGPSQRPHIVPFPLASTGPVPRGVNRGNTTIATGPAAVAMARGFAPTGLGASSYGRDRMMTQYREA